MNGNLKKAAAGIFTVAFALIWVTGTALASDSNCSLKQTDNGEWIYYENGEEVPDKYGFVNWNGGKFFIAYGKVAAGANGLAQDPDNADNWYYCSNGQVQTQYTGLVEYDSEWFYVSQGKLDTTLAAVIDYDTGKFLVAAGRILREVNGLAQDPATGIWYFFAEGQAQLQYTGLAGYNGGWFYIVDGRFISNYVGLVETMDGDTWLVEGGMLDTSKDGFQVYYDEAGNAAACQLDHGMLVSDLNGMVENEYGVWRFINGRVDYTSELIKEVLYYHDYIRAITLDDFEIDAEAYTALNEFRADPENQWYWNEDNTAKIYTTDLTEITRDSNLEEIAMERAMESYFICRRYNVLTHDRLSGPDWFSAYTRVNAVSECLAVSVNWNMFYRQGLGWYYIKEGWAETYNDYEGQGHRRALLSDKATLAGMARFNGVDDEFGIWALCLGY